MFDLRTSLEKRLLVFPDCACCGLALTTIMSFSFSWSQSCRSPTCLCSRTLCMSWTSLMVLFLQRQQIPLLTQGPPQSSVNSFMIKSSIYLSDLASICKLLRKSTRAKVLKCLKKNIFTKMNPVKLWLRKGVRLPLKHWCLTIVPSLPYFPTVCGRQKDKPLKILLKKSSIGAAKKLVGQPFVWGRSSPLYTG